jgi:hydroxysqualene synthase
MYGSESTLSIAGGAGPAARITAVNGVDHYENFPVASVLCPPRLRPAVVAIYRFARTADDIADEGDAPASQRLADLAAYRADLQAIYAGRPPGGRWPGVFGPLDAMRRQHDLPQAPLADLLDAFEQDVHNPAYPDRAALLDYCRRSADPIGRLLLHLYRVDDLGARRQSDAICSALQLTNFWQDLSRDLPRRRCYVPQSDLAGRPPLQAGRDTAETRALVRDLCIWSRELMLAGAPLVHALPGRAGWELRLVVQGGLRILETIGRMDHAVMSRRPSLGALDVIVMAWRALWMRR